MLNGSTLLGNYKARDGRSGAGGWIVNCGFALDGAKMIGADTFDGYSAPPGTDIVWEQNLRPGENVDQDDLDMFYTAGGGEASPWVSGGTFDCAIAPSNSDVRYKIVLGRVWVTQDAEETWELCSLPSQAKLEPNSPVRMMGKALAVDPINPSICIAALPTGVFILTGYGAAYTTVSTGTIPTPTYPSTDHGRMCVAFDPSSATTGGKTQGIYILSNGNGLYHSTNAGVAWAAITASPTLPGRADHLKIGDNGYVYLTGDGGGNTNAQFRRWSGAWLEPTGISCKGIALSRHHPGRIYICGPQGGLGVSTNYGANGSWQLGGYIMANVRISPDIPWQQFTNEVYMSNGDIEEDPIDDRLWCFEGIGVWYMNNPPSVISGYSQKAIWTSCSHGINNMVCFTSKFSPSGNLGMAIGDRAAFVWPKARIGKNYPIQHPTTTSAIQNGGSCDFAPEDENFCGFATTFCGSAAYTEDLGETFIEVETLASTPGATGIGGNIVCLDKDRWILIETNKGKVWRTESRGQPTVDMPYGWERIVVGTDTAQMWHAFYYHSRRILIRDKNVEGRAFAYNHGEGDPGSAADADRGLWRFDNYGLSKTKILNGFIIGYGADYYHGKLTQYDDDTLLWCGGDNALGLWTVSNLDGGTNSAIKTEITGTDDISGAVHFGEVYAVGVAKGLANSDHPAVLVAGSRMASPANLALTKNIEPYGFWLSLDGMQTWKFLGRFLNGNFDLVYDIAGDPSTFARFNICYTGSGNRIFDYIYERNLI